MEDNEIDITVSIHYTESHILNSINSTKLQPPTPHQQTHSPTYLPAPNNLSKSATPAALLPPSFPAFSLNATPINFLFPSCTSSTFSSILPSTTSLQTVVSLLCPKRCTRSTA